MAPALAGHVAIITGASSGLGCATAIALARAGAGVGLLARSAPDLEGVADALGTEGRAALPVACDLADGGSIERAVEEVRRELGPVRVLVNAAATDAPAPVSELSLDAWDRVLAVNLRAVFLLSRLAVSDMVAAGQGTIVNVSSVAGRRGWANASAYCASKFALTGFTQALAAEHDRRDPRTALPPETVADFIAWIATAPSELVLNEATVTPLNEEGWP